MEKLSKDDKLKLRFKMVDSAAKIGISETARLFKVNRNTVSQWVKRYQQEGEAGLQNRSKKGVNYPNKMPRNLENRIVAYKKKNPNATATKIIKELKLQYSVSIVVKKLRDAGLWQNQKVRLNLNERGRLSPYEFIFINIIKLELNAKNKLPGYLFSAIDYVSGFTFYSFSYDIYEPALASFIENIIKQLSSAGIESEWLNFVPLKKSIISYTRRKKSAINVILQRYKSKLKFINDEKRKEFIAQIEPGNFTSWYNKENFSSLLNLLAKTHLYSMNYNLKQNYPIEPISILPTVFFYPNLDVVERDKEQLIPEKQKIFQYTLKLTQKSIAESLKSYDYYTALDLLKVQLTLIGALPDYTNLRIEALLKKGELLKNCGTLEKTELLLKQANRLAKLSKNRELLVKTSFALAEFYGDIQDTTQSITFLEITLRNSKIASDIYMEAKAANRLALLHLKKGRSRKTLGLLIYYLKKSKLLGNKPLVVDFYMGMARYYNSKGDEQKVIKYLFKAERLAEEISEPEAFFKVYYPLLSISFKSKMPDEFIITYRDKMKNLIPQLQDRIQTLNALNSVGCAEINLNNPDEALKIFLEQLQLAEKLGLKFMICSALINIGNRFMNVGKNSNALTYLTKGYQISREIQFYEGIYSSCINISNIYSTKGEFDDALDYSNKGLVLARQMGNKYYQTDFLLTEGAILLEKKQPQLASTKFRKAMRIAKETKNKPQIATAYNNLSVALNDMDRVKPALQNIEKALTLVLVYKSRYHHCLFAYNKARYLFKNGENSSALNILTLAEELAKKLNNRYVLSNGAKLREKILNKM